MESGDLLYLIGIKEKLIGQWIEASCWVTNVPKDAIPMLISPIVIVNGAKIIPNQSANGYMLGNIAYIRRDNPIFK